METSAYCNRFWRRSLSRRAVLRAGTAGAGGLAALALAGCGDSNKSGGRGGAQANLEGELAGAKYGGTFNIDQQSDPVNLDNHKSEDPATVYAANITYEHLLRRWENYEKEPGVVYVGPELAAEWELADETTYVFKLQRNVKWHNLPPVNGRPFTAADVKYSIDRMRGSDPQLRTRNAFEMVDRVETPNDYTVVLRMKQPYAPLIANAGNTWAVIVPPELGDTDTINTKAVGTGPFMLQEWQRGVGLRWKRNPEYWRKGLPFFDGVHMRLVTDPAARIANFRAGETSTWGGSYNTTPRETIDQVLRSVPDARLVERPSSGTFITVSFNTRERPFSDIRIRQAIKYGLDYDRLIALLGGRAERTGPIVPLNVAWALKPEELPKTDMARARTLLEQAGYGPDNPLRVTCRVSRVYTGQEVAQVLQAFLKPLGIQVNIEVMELGEWLAKVYSTGQDYQFTGHGNYAWEDPDWGLYSYFHSRGTQNNSHYSNPDVDRLLEAQRREFDEERRKKLVREIQLKLIEDAPWLWLISPGSATLVRNNLKNYKIMVHGNSNSYRQLGFMWFDPVR